MTDAHLIGAVAELKRYAADEEGTTSYLTKAEAQAILSLLIEADSAISHQHYRGIWPLDRFETDRLIVRLRRAS